VVIALDEAQGKGSGRSISGVDLGAAIIAAREAGLLVAGGGDNLVRILPPLNFTRDEAREAIERLEKTCEFARTKLAAA
jgi:acetylornithine/succinyldiaminopimelate/putrescine aminotransferase